MLKNIYNYIYIIYIFLIKQKESLKIIFIWLLKNNTYNNINLLFINCLNMRKFLLIVSFIFLLIWNVNWFQLINSKKEIDFLEKTNINQVSFLVKNFNEICNEKCDVGLIIENEEKKIKSLTLSWKKDKVEELYNILKKESNKDYSKILKNMDINQQNYFSNIQKWENDKKYLSSKNWTITIITLLLVVVLYFLFEWGEFSIKTWMWVVWVYCLIVFMITVYTNSLINNNPFKETKFWNYNEKEVNYIFVDYLDKLSINWVSQEELKYRDNLNYYYTDIILSDKDWFPIKTLDNNIRKKAKENALKYYNSIFQNSNNENIIFYETDYWILIRFQEHKTKEILMKTWQIVLSVWIIALKHKVSSKIVWKNNIWTFSNNMTTIAMVSDLMISLQSNMKEIYIPTE